MKQILIIIGLLLCLNSNAIIPDRKYVRLPQEVGMIYKELNVVTKDGYRMQQIRNLTAIPRCWM